MRSILGLVSLLAAPSVSAAEAFSGWHVGVAAGAVESHFVVEDALGRKVAEPSAWGPGVSGFAGHDWMIGRTVLVGVGGEINLGGRTARADLPGVGFASISPRWGYTLTARVGAVPLSGVLLYARGGYVAHRYRLSNNGISLDFGEWNRSFTIGGGAEVALGKRVAARLEVHHLDGTRNQIMLGVPIRF